MSSLSVVPICKQRLPVIDQEDWIYTFLRSSISASVCYKSLRALTVVHLLFIIINMNFLPFVCFRWSRIIFLSLTLSYEFLQHNFNFLLCANPVPLCNPHNSPLVWVACREGGYDCFVFHQQFSAGYLRSDATLILTQHKF